MCGDVAFYTMLAGVALGIMLGICFVAAKPKWFLNIKAKNDG